MDNLLVIDFSKGEAGKELKRIYQPYKGIPPHLTLCHISKEIGPEELRDLERIISGTERFRLTLQGFRNQRWSSGYYLYFLVQQGQEYISNLKKQLTRFYKDQPNDDAPHLTLSFSKEEQEIDRRIKELERLNLKYMIDVTSIQLLSDKVHTFNLLGKAPQITLDDLT